MNPYPNYKPSGIEWIVEIPSHWEETKLKYIGYLYAGLTGKSGEDFKQTDNPQNKPFIPFTNIANNLKINPNQLDKVVMSEDDEQNKVVKNDLFFMMSSENFDDVGKATILLNDLGECYLNSFCKGFRVTDKNVHSPYLNYLLLNDAYRRRLMIEANGFTRINLKMEKVNDFEISLPPLEEQTTIANFLDDKTKQIDKLISNKQKLIELLKEERTAIINEAVSGKGKNWERKKLKYVAKLKSGDGITADDIRPEGDYPVYGGNGLRGYSSAFTHEGKYVLIGRQGALCGNINYAYGKFFASEHAVVVSILDGSEFVWLGELLRSMNLNQYSQASAQPGLSVEKLQNLTITVPPSKEQTAIVHRIQTETQRIDSTISKIEKEIELMNEYRTALISEIVTGKIKVT